MAILGQSSLVMPVQTELNLLRRSWGLILALGLLLTAVGVAAVTIALSSFAFDWTVATILVFGILLAAAGVVQLATALIARTWRGVFLHLLVGVLYVVLGALMIRHPARAAAGITLMIAAGFLVGGLFRIVYSLGTDRFPGWGWVLGNGVVTLIMGVLIWAQWPESAEWVIGLYVGIDLFSAGGAWVVLALALRKKPEPAPAV
jgi:uncharacterized membrane protein HdeD (DUF308 family)